MNKNNFSSGEVLSTIPLNIQSDLGKFNTLSGNNFKNNSEFKIAINEVVKGSFDEASDILKNFGYGNIENLQKVGFDYQNTVKTISDSIEMVLEQGIVYNEDGTFSIDFGEESIKRMGKYTQDRIGELKSYSQKYTINSEERKFYDNSVKILANHLNQSIDRLASELDNSNVPVNMVNKSIPKTWHYKAKYLLMPLTSIFMGYGVYGGIMNFAERKMDEARMAGVYDSLAEGFISSGYFANGTATVIGGIVAIAVTLGMYKIYSNNYNNVLEYQEREKKKGRNVKNGTSDIFIKHGNWKRSIFGTIIAGFLAWEGAAMVYNENQNIQTNQVIKDKGTLLHSTITTRMNEVIPDFNTSINDMEIANSEILSDELKTGPGAFYHGKSFLIRGDAVINDILKSKINKKEEITFVSEKVREAEAKVQEAYDYHNIDRKKFNNYVDFLKYSSERQEILLKELANYAYNEKNPEEGIYSKLEKKGEEGKVMRYEFHENDGEYREKFEGVKAELKNNYELGIKLYEIYSNLLAELGNAQGKSLKITEPKSINLEVELQEILNKTPNLEGKGVFEYVGLLFDYYQEGKVEGIVLLNIALFLFLRVVVIELGSMAIMFNIMKSRLETRRRQGYGLEEQEKEISEFYEECVDSIQKIFSGEDWKKIFGNQGIDREVAEMIFKIFLAEKDSDLKKIFLIKEEGEDLNEKGQFLELLKKAYTGNILNEREIFVEKLYKIFSEMTKQSKTGNEDEKGFIPKFSYEDLNYIVSQIIPEKAFHKKELVSRSFDEFLKIYFDENIMEMKVPRKDLYEVSELAFEPYMSNNVIQSSEIFEVEKLKEFLEKYFSEEYQDELKNALQKLEANSKDGKISKFILEEEIIKKELPVWEDEIMGKFYKELNENISNSEITIGEFLEIIDECSGNKDKFLDYLKNISDDKITSWISDIDLNEENLAKIKQQLEQKFPHKYDNEKIKKFLDKISGKNEILGKIPYLEKVPKIPYAKKVSDTVDIFKQKVFKLQNSKEIKKITRDEFIDLASGIFYDENMNETQTLAQMQRNIEELKTKVGLSNDAKYFKNLKEGEKILKEKISVLEKKYSKVKKYFKNIGNEEIIEDSIPTTYDEIFSKIKLEIENFDFGKMEDLGILEKRIKDFEDDLYHYVYYSTLLTISDYNSPYYLAIEEENKNENRSIEKVLEIYKNVLGKNGGNFLNSDITNIEELKEIDKGIVGGIEEKMEVTGEKLMEENKKESKLKRIFFTDIRELFKRNKNRINQNRNKKGKNINLISRKKNSIWEKLKKIGKNNRRNKK